MLAACLLRKYTRENDNLEQIRKKDVIIKLCLVIGCSRVVGSTVGLTDPSEKTFVWLILNIIGVLLKLWAMVHMYFFNLTPVVKVAIIVGSSADVFVRCAADAETPWYFCQILLLDLCLLLESEKDRALMKNVSLVIRVVTVIYLVVRALSELDVIPCIHVLNGACDHIPVAQDVVLANFMMAVFTILCNFSFVSSYAINAHNEAQAMRESADMATSIARNLVNFDLATAQDKLMEFDHSRSPIREPLHGLLRNLTSYRGFLPYSLFSQDIHEDTPNEIIADAMQGQVTSWQHVGRAVGKLRNPTYTLGDFHQDVTAAFPELRLYNLELDGTCSSGLTGFEEYQRTMGAMYAIYCLARLDIDGKQLLSFGVDEKWQPAGKSSGNAADRMDNFYKTMDWEGLARLMVRAHIITVEGPPGRSILREAISSSGSGSGRGEKNVESTQDAARIKLNEERMTAMLVLTAIHDIMKNSCLLPKVQERHAPYNNLSKGADIADHDMALAYVLEHFPSLLPSYYGLEAGQRAPVLFTQGKMGFNNGWLVQGEAPPAALFSNFKKVIVQGCASEADISFYFVHWLTDLAGAEPRGSRPWPGAEKFVSKFPLRVLNAFLESFSFVDHLAVESEVEVMEDYLEGRWAAFGPPEQDLADGHAPAAMRLALMAQGFETEVVDALLALRPEDRETIALEMARTGQTQQFRSAPASLRRQPDGPALLVYYAPALVQKAGVSQAVNALRILASVYRAARQFFPVEGHSAERTVTVRIDALKVLSPKEIFEVGRWHLKKTSDSDACVVRQAQPEGSSAGDGSTDAITEIFLHADGGTLGEP